MATQTYTQEILNLKQDMNNFSKKLHSLENRLNTMEQKIDLIFEKLDTSNNLPSMPIFNKSTSSTHIDPSKFTPLATSSKHQQPHSSSLLEMKDKEIKELKLVNQKLTTQITEMCNEQQSLQNRMNQLEQILTHDRK